MGRELGGTGVARSPDAWRRRTSCSNAASRRRSATHSTSSPRSGPPRMPRRTRSPGSASRRGGRSRPRWHRAATISRSSGRAARSRCADSADESQRLSAELADPFSGRDPDHADSAAGDRRGARGAARAAGARARAARSGRRRTITRRPRSSGPPTFAARRISLLKDGAGSRRAIPEHPRPSRRGADSRRSIRCAAAGARPRARACRRDATRRARPTNGSSTLWEGADPRRSSSLQAARREICRGCRTSSARLTCHVVVTRSARRTCFSTRSRSAPSDRRRSSSRRAATMRRCARKPSRCCSFTTTRSDQRSGARAGREPDSRRAKCSPAATG